MKKLLMLTLCFGLVYADLRPEYKEPSELVYISLPIGRELLNILCQYAKGIFMICQNYKALSSYYENENLQKLNRKKSVKCPNVKSFVEQNDEYSTMFVLASRRGHELTKEEIEEYKNWVEKFLSPDNKVIELNEEENCVLMYILLDEFSSKREE